MSEMIKMLQFARKAGKLFMGSETALAKIRTGKAGLVILAADVSANTEKRFRDACGYRQVKIIKTDMESGAFAEALGKQGKTAVAAIGDENFIRAVENAASKNGGLH